MAARGIGRALVVYALLALGFTWPLATALGTSVVGWAGDNYYFVWLIGWYEEALIRLQRSPLVAPHLNYPEGWHLAGNELTPAMVLPALPVSLAGGPVLAYNLVLLASFVLSGLGVYLWVWRLTRRQWPALLAGVAFAFLPYRMSHLLGHLNLMGTQWLPFYFMSLEGLARRRRRSPGHIAVALVFLGLIGLTSQYYLYMTLVLSVVFAAAWLLLANRPGPGRAVAGGRLAVLALLALPVALVTAAPYVQLQRSGQGLRHTLEEARYWSASPTDFVLPSPRHPIWGDWVRQRFGRARWIEQTLYLGAAAGALATVGLAAAMRRPRWRRPALAIGIGAGAAFVLALGTDLHWLDQAVTVEVPAALRWLHPHERTFLPLPGYFLYRWLPYYGGMRVWMRYGIFVGMFASVLAGLGATTLLRRLRGSAGLAAALLLAALVGLDFAGGRQELTEVRGRPVDLWLAQQPGEGAVAEMPFYRVADPTRTYFTLVHGKPFVGGFFAAFAPEQYRAISPVMAGFPDAASVDLMRQLGVRYVVVDAAAYDLPDLAETLAALGLERAVAAGNEVVYSLSR